MDISIPLIKQILNVPERIAIKIWNICQESEEKEGDSDEQIDLEK